MPDPTTIEIEDSHDRWRFRCPNGHTTWEPTNYHFWCQKCAQRPGVDATFQRLYDQREDREVEREEIRLVDEIGLYHSDRAGGSA